MPLIIKIADAPSFDLPHGRGKSIRLFNPSNGTTNVDVHINVLDPGVRKGTIHYHKYIEDIYLVLEGEGRIMDDDGNEYPIEAGDAIYFKPGELVDTHEVYNTGKSPLRIIEIYAPPQPKESYIGSKIDMSKRDHVAIRDTG